MFAKSIGRFNHTEIFRRYFRYDQIGSWSPPFVLPAGQYVLLSRSPVDFRSDDIYVLGVTYYIIVLSRDNKCTVRMTDSTSNTLEYVLIMETRMDGLDIFPPTRGFSSYNVIAVPWPINTTAQPVTNTQWTAIEGPRGSPTVLLLDKIMAIRSSGAARSTIVLRNRITDITFVDSGATGFFDILNTRIIDPQTVANFSLAEEFSRPLIVPANMSLIVGGNTDAVNADNLFVEVSGRYFI